MLEGTFSHSQPELTPHTFEDALIGRMGDDQADLVDFDSGLLANTAHRLGHQPDRLPVETAPSHHRPMQTRSI